VISIAALASPLVPGFTSPAKVAGEAGRGKACANPGCRVLPYGAAAAGRCSSSSSPTLRSAVRRSAEPDCCD